MTVVNDANIVGQPAPSMVTIPRHTMEMALVSITQHGRFVGLISARNAQFSEPTRAAYSQSPRRRCCMKACGISKTGILICMWTVRRRRNGRTQAPS